MQHLDSKTSASRAIVRELSKLAQDDKLTTSYLLKHYHDRPLLWKTKNDQQLDKDGKILKSLHSILQVGVFFTNKGNLALFKRPDKERDDTQKVTDGFSALKSWSPASLHQEELSLALAKKAYLTAGPLLKWIPRGIALTDIFERSNAFAPHYLFLLYEIPLENEERLGNKAQLNERNKTELFAGWLKPDKYAAHQFPKEFFDPYTERNVPCEIRGAVDRLLITSLQRGDKVELEDTTRGYARYFPNSALKTDSASVDFEVAGIEIDPHMQDLVKVIEAVRKSRDETKEVSLQDVLLFQPNYHGIGIRGPEFIRWFRSLYARAFN